MWACAGHCATQDDASHPHSPLIFDPQPAGDLLASVPAGRAREDVVAWQTLGYAHTTVIGRILAQGDALEPLCCCPEGREIT